MYQEKNWKKNKLFPLDEQKNNTSQSANSAPHLERWTRYLDTDTQEKFLKSKWPLENQYSY